MNYGIGNVKAKVSGGGTPTITIDVSQMIDQTTAQLTNEQYEIIENNGFINVVLPNSQSCGFNRFIDAYGDYHLAMCSGGASEITYFSVSINSTTKIATISIGDFSGGGAGTPLYEHTIQLWQSSEIATQKFRVYFKIISTQSTAYTLQTLTAYLKTIMDSNTRYEATGKFYTSGVLYLINGISYNTQYDEIVLEKLELWITGQVAEIAARVPSRLGEIDGSIGFSDNTIIPLGTASINGGGGTQLYQHNISCSFVNGYRYYVRIINDSATPFASTAYVAAYLYAKGFTSLNNAYQCTGGKKETTLTYDAMYSNNGITLQLTYNLSTQNTYQTQTCSGDEAFTDNVITL